MEQNGKTALVTGANTGLRFEMARALARRGAHVVVAGRSGDKVRSAIESLTADDPDASLEIGLVDLNSLASVQEFAQDIATRHDKLDILINNAGVMVPPAGQTIDG